MVQNCKPSIICLEDGTQLCCGILDDTEDSALITTTFPLEILRIKVSHTTEAISLRPWLTFTQVATFDIRQSKVVTITPLHSDYHDEFYKMTNHYMETQNDTLDFTDSVYDDIEDQLQEMDDESFDELMNRIKNIGPNRKLH
jgi:hypothetical protein